MDLEPVDVVAPAGIEVDAEGMRWQIHNTTAEPVVVDAVRRRLTVRHDGPLRIYRHGYQSWTRSGLAILGEDRDPSAIDGSLSLMRAMHHADETVTDALELRSEFVTVLADDHDAVILGADGGDRHDTTFRLRPLEPGRAELVVEAFLGGAALAPGAGAALHDVLSDHADDVAASLGWWAGSVGRRNRARVGAPYQLGWCSWYQYFHALTEADVRHNLDLATDWPFDVFQIDDGYQSAIGDWLTVNDKFSSSIDQLARDIDSAGLTPGIWIAPFLAAPESVVMTRHPDWIVERKPGRPLIGMVNDGWGGAVFTLDSTHPEVLAHLETTAAALVERGYRYLKLDFTYAPSMPGHYHDASQTPAQRVRAGYDAIRRGAGDDVFILGCGAPLGACVGAVDGMRIGADVAPWWDVRPNQFRPPGYEGNEPATANAFQNTLSRAFQHRRLWLNDPDCLMLRTTDTHLTEAEVDRWADAVGVSGGMALVSDDLAKLDVASRRRLDRAIDQGKRSDDATRHGAIPTCKDLMTNREASQLVCGEQRLES